MEERKLKILFSKSGSGSTNTRISLPIKDLKDMGITPKNREIIYEYNEEKKEIKLKKSN